MDDISDEELERRMSAKLFGREARKGPVVEVRRSRTPKKPVPVVEAVAKEIPIMEGGDDCWVVTFTSLLPDGKRIHLKSIRSPATIDHRQVIREYEAEGRIIQWASKTPEEMLDDDGC